MAECCDTDVSFCVTRGDTEQLYFDFSAFSTLAGYDFKMVVVASTDLNTAVLTFTVGSGITVTDNATVKTAVVTYSIANTTALQAGTTYYSDMKITKPDATVHHLPVRFVHNVSTPVTP